jgi:hypothetical protein
MSVIKQGTILTFEHGEYSDRGWDGPFTVLKDVDQAEVRDVFLGEWRATPHEDWERASEYDFIGWLSRTGYIEDVPNQRSWFIGSYGFEPDIDREPSP